MDDRRPPWLASQYGINYNRILILAKQENKEWQAFIEFRDAFKKQVELWQAQYPDIEFVYNKALDDLTEEDRIACILVGDNPRETEKREGKYYVGKVGEFCRKIFEEDIFTKEVYDRFWDMIKPGHFDFDKNIICLHKTPIATAKTSELKKLPKTIVEETQQWMAEHIAKLHQRMHDDDFPELWLMGAPQLKPSRRTRPLRRGGATQLIPEGFFVTFAKHFKKAYSGKRKLLNTVLVFKYFSDGFVRDLNACYLWSEEGTHKYIMYETEECEETGEEIVLTDDDGNEIVDRETTSEFLVYRTKLDEDPELKEEDDDAIISYEHCKIEIDDPRRVIGMLNLVGAYHRCEIFKTKPFHKDSAFDWCL
jgi:hypothetical protein